MNSDLNVKGKYSSDSEVSHYSCNKELQAPEITIFQKYKSEIENKKILDIGCGGGRTTKYLAEFSSNYVGIDYSKGMIDSCKSQYENLSFIHCDVRDMSIFNNEEFDFIIFSFNGIDCISHEGRIKALNEIYRILKPNGLYVFSAHNLNYKNVPYVPGIFTRKNPIEIAKNFKKRLTYLKNKKYEVHTDEYSIITCPVYGYTSYMYYIKKEKQIKQLENLGFNDIEIVDFNGEFINIDSLDKENCWLYYVCRK